jgi:hypothetical protein
MCSTAVPRSRALELFRASLPALQPHGRRVHSATLPSRTCADEGMTLCSHRRSGQALVLCGLGAADQTISPRFDQKRCGHHPNRISKSHGSREMHNSSLWQMDRDFKDNEDTCTDGADVLVLWEPSEQLSIMCFVSWALPLSCEPNVTFAWHPAM